jgi:hypothetical protein
MRYTASEVNMFIRESGVTTTPNQPQTSGTQAGWDPSTISNIVFGICMVFVGIVALWQGRRRRVVVIDGRDSSYPLSMRHWLIRYRRGNGNH